MIRDKYFFNMDKNILRGCLEDLTYMYSPGDDVNKDRVVSMLEPSDDEDDDDDDSESNDDEINGDVSLQQFQEMMMKQLGGIDLNAMMSGMNNPANQQGKPEQQTDETDKEDENVVEELTTDSKKESGGAE